MSSLRIGIVGLPNVGKSTLFNALTSGSALAANYPFATIEPNVGVVGVPDERLAALGALYPDAPRVAATVSFTDIAGLVAGASQGEGLGNQFLANIRETDAIAHVVRAFNDTNVTHVDSTPDPARDITTINTELILADLATLSKRREHLARAAKAQASLRRDVDTLDELIAALDSGQLVRAAVAPNTLDAYLEQAKVEHDTRTTITQLLTAKPQLFVFNVDEATAGDPKRQAELATLVAPLECVFVCAQIEAELNELDPDEAQEMLQEYGQSESGLHQLIQAGFRALGLQCFFTAGDKEVRGWTIPRGATAPQAAGTIHSDMERGFIAAEVINWQELTNAGSKAAARSQGLLRSEGKDYLMQDGDVVEFKFNV